MPRLHAVVMCDGWLLVLYSCLQGAAPCNQMSTCQTTAATSAPLCAQDIGSGNCAVHNTLLLDHVQKSVLRAPWRFHPMPFWCGGRQGAGVGQRGPKYVQGGMCASKRCHACTRASLLSSLPMPAARPRPACFPFCQPSFRSPSHRNLEAMGRAALRFCANPSMRAMLPLAGQALQG